MVMELLGPSLEEIFAGCNRRFSLKTTLMLADQMLFRIQYMHMLSFIHRDIKPDNFLMGLGKRSCILYLIDFGLAKKYKDPKNKQHIPYRDRRNLTGTARYASINAHLGIEQSRRDDLESIGYVLCYFLKGQLPWQGIHAGTKQEKYQKIKDKKITTPVEILCKGVCSELSQYLNYVRALRFEEDPNYDQLRRIFKELFIREGLIYDYLYDWVVNSWKVPKQKKKKKRKKKRRHITSQSRSMSRSVSRSQSRSVSPSAVPRTPFKNKRNKDYSNLPTMGSSSNPDIVNPTNFDPDGPFIQQQKEEEKQKQIEEELK